MSEIEAVGLSTRARNCLLRGGYTTAAEVRAASDGDLLDIRNMGVISLAEIREVIGGPPAEASADRQRPHPASRASVITNHGRLETWISTPLPGGWVCAEPDPAGPDGLCGMPVEDAPCSIHHPGEAD